MKPPPFDHHAPADLPSALALLRELGAAGEVRVLAGGQSLVPVLAFRLAAPDALVDLNRIAELQTVGTADQGALAGGLRLGAMVRTRRLETDPAIAAAHPLLAAAARHVAHVQIRNRGTIGGSLAHADPAAELPGVALACDAVLTAESAGGRRDIAARDFFDSVFTTALADDEILTAVTFPPWPAARRWGFREVSRRDGDFAMVGIAAWYDTGADGAISDCGLAAIGAGDTPLRLPSAEAALRGKAPTAESFAAAAAATPGDLDPRDDLHASAAYRREVGAVLVERVLAAAAARGAAAGAGA